ncbi:MAG: 3D domain-containing protein [Candidatus Saganbacteria bacterium]|nr:3D domain-containing protein [Candidatus Saganbacteria bacterium]
MLIAGHYRIAYSDVSTATAYNSMVGQCDSTPWITASGTRCRPGVVAANHLPIGTKIVIEGFGDQVFTVEDRMNRRYTDRIDIWMLRYSDALDFGRRQIKYHVLESV